MKNTKASISPLRNVGGNKVFEIKMRLLCFIREQPRATLDIARLFGIDVSTVSASDCTYKYVLDELIREGRIERHQNGTRYLYRIPELTLF